MTSTDPRPDIAGRAPAPAVAGLTDGRRAQLKGHLLREITRGPAPARPRWRLAIAAASVVAAAGAVVAVHPWSTGVPVSHAAPGVVALLDRAAGVAGSQPALTVGPHQFVYVKSTSRYAEFTTPRYTLRPETVREVWLSADGSRPGLLRTTGEPDTTLAANPHPTLYNPTYAFLTSLPRDPDTLLRRIYRDTKGAGSGPDDEAFVTIGDLMRESVCVPDLAAALFRAAERIPGVKVVDGADDELGRPVLAVGRDDSTGRSTRWFFDPHTYQFMGEYTVWTRDTPDSGLRPGDVIGVSAVISRGVVDAAGDVPRTTI